MPKRKEIPPRVKLKIMKRDHYTCQICGKSPASYPELELEVDHIIPVTKGGDNDFENLPREAVVVRTDPEGLKEARVQVQIMHNRDEREGRGLPIFSAEHSENSNTLGLNIMGNESTCKEGEIVLKGEKKGFNLYPESDKLRETNHGLNANDSRYGDAS